MRPGVSLSFVLHLVLHCELISITSFNAQNTIEGRCRCPLVRMRTLAFREHKSCPMDTVGTWGLVLTRVLLEVGFSSCDSGLCSSLPSVLQWALRKVPVPCKSTVWFLESGFKRRKTQLILNSVFSVPLKDNLLVGLSVPWVQLASFSRELQANWYWLGLLLGTGLSWLLSAVRHCG